MRWRSVLLVVALAAAAVAVADFSLRSSLLGVAFPRIETPSDGAHLSGEPLTVRWRGPQRMRASISGPGGHHELGLRTTPFEIAAEIVAAAGDYIIELRPPYIGSWFATRLSVTVAHSTARNGRRPPGNGGQDNRQDEIDALRAERDTANTVNAELFEENARLRRHNAELQDANTGLQIEHDARGEDIETLTGERNTLQGRQAALEEENRVLRARLGSIPPCLAWGYLTYPRPQLLPRTRRVVVVSNSRGDIFRDERDCEIVRRQDSTAASRCDCVAGL